MAVRSVHTRAKGLERVTVRASIISARFIPGDIACANSTASHVTGMQPKNGSKSLLPPPLVDGNRIHRSPCFRLGQLLTLGALMRLGLGELRSVLDVELFALLPDLLQCLLDGFPIPAAVAGVGVRR